MRARSLLAAVVVVVGLSVPASRALARRPGEITSDVTVREWPADDAPSVGELGAGATVVAYGHRHGWLRVTGAARGWIPNEAFTATPDDNDQRKALLAQIAAAADAAGQPEEKTDADLMYEALKQQWRGQLPGSAAIDKVVAQSKSDADRDRHVLREKIRKLFWKDPFSENPQKLIPVRREDRDLLASHPTATRTRSERGGDEASRLRAEVAHLRSELARAEADRGECVASDDGGGVRLARHLGASHVRRAERVEAMNSQSDTDTPRPAHRRTQRTQLLTSVTPAAAPAPEDKTVALPPPGWRSSDPRGIIVVPISEPIPVQADSKPSRRSR
jgi:hypothetical protein